METEESPIRIQHILSTTGKNETGIQLIIEPEGYLNAQVTCRRFEEKGPVLLNESLTYYSNKYLSEIFNGTVKETDKDGNYETLKRLIDEAHKKGFIK